MPRQLPDSSADDLHLLPFARRIRLLRAWRCLAIGGALGASVALLLSALDFFSLVYSPPWLLAVPIGMGVIGGIVKAVFERLPASVVARSVDRRGGLSDRLTTATEVARSSGNADGLGGALHDDAARRVAAVRPAALYPLRAGRWHGALATLALLAASVFLLGNTSFFKSEQAKKDAQELKKTADEVQRVVKPALEQAKKPNATPTEKELARRLDKFTQELRRARMTKPEALVKANELANQAKKLEASRNLALAQSVESAQTAAQKLAKMTERAGLEKSSDVAGKLAEQAAALEDQIAALEKQIAKDAQNTNSQDKLSPEQKAALDKKLAALKQQLKEIKLSQQAQEMLAKLAANADFQKAQELLAKLASQQAPAQAASDSGAPSPLTQAQIDAAVKKLEELAKRLSTDAALAEFAKQLLEAAKNAQLCKGGQCAGGLLGAFGLGGAGSGQMPGLGGLSLGGMKGAGAASQDRWVGAHGNLHKDDKSALLNVKFSDRIITSQIGDKGPQTYTEVLGPSTPGAKSSVPFQNVLPRYEKGAEAALNKGDVPPKLRGKVRDYFDSLRK